jgi:hypothetical protein
VDLIASAEGDLPVLTNAVDSKTAIGAPAEPVLGADAIDDRAVDPSARECDEGNAPPVEPCGRFEKSSCSVADKVVKLDAPLRPPRARKNTYSQFPSSVHLQQIVLLERQRVDPTWRPFVT